jgi:uncharacterized membrane protein
MIFARISPRIRSVPGHNRVWVVLRWLALALVLLAAREWGGGSVAGLLAGTLHGIAYGALLASFGATLLPGRTPMVTRIAERLNPSFNARMRLYTRRVTSAWCLVFAGELAASALLLLWGAHAMWLGFVSLGHLLPVALLFLGEYALRRCLFGRDSTDMATMLRAIRGRTGGL